MVKCKLALYKSTLSTLHRGGRGKMRMVCSFSSLLIELVGLIFLKISLCIVIIWLVLVARSDWLILGYYSPVMPTGRLWAFKNKAKSHVINYLTSNVRSSRGNSQTSILPYWVVINSVNAGMYWLITLYFRCKQLKNTRKWHPIGNWACSGSRDMT